MSEPSCSALAARLRAVTDGCEALGDVAGLRVFDTLGALAAGASVQATRALPPDPGLLGEVRRACAAARCTEVDDFERLSCTTPGSVAVPVALLVGADRDAPPGRVLAGVVAGYEAMVAVGEAIDGPARLARGVWPSYLGAPVAAAAATAATLGLDDGRTAHALAIAATRAVGTAGRIAQEPMSRWLVYGCAAADGVLAALAAEAGMLGDLDALAGALPAATGVAFDAARIPAPAPRIAGMDVKPFCTARQALAAVEAAREARAEAGGGAVREIEVAVPAAYRAMIDRPEPAGRLESIVSAQRQIALALTDDDGLYDVARGDLALPEGAAELMRVTRVVADDELGALYPEAWGARVRVRTDAGEATRLVREPLGGRERPLGWDELRSKHERIGAWGDALPRALRLCRDLGAGALPARELLDLTTEDLRQEVVS